MASEDWEAWTSVQVLVTWHAGAKLILAALELYRMSLLEYEILAGEQVRVKQKDLGSTNAPAKTSNLSVDFRPTRI